MIAMEQLYTGLNSKHDFMPDNRGPVFVAMTESQSICNVLFREMVLLLDYRQQV
jgi:hypothetical protein